MSKLVDFIHYLFVPKEENNYKVKALHTDFLSFYLIFALILTFLFKNIGSVSNNILGFATDISVEKLYTLTNQEREKNSLKKLIYNQKLAEAAQKKADNMFKKDYWAHYAPDGRTPWDFMLDSGYKYEYAGENLARNFLFSNNVVEAWMKSESHRKNILRPEYEEIGFAIVNGVLNNEETTLVVQMFGKPQTLSLTPDTQPNEINKYQNKVLNPGRESVLAKETNAPKINLMRTLTNFNLVFIFLLILALILDLYFSIKLNIFRISGKNLAHLIFLSFIILSLFYITKGAVL